MSMFRRAAWMKWFPPMAVASPSPVTTMTVRSGRAIFTPVAKVIARPCVVWSVFTSTYPGVRLEQPMPETMQISSRERPIRSIARRIALRTIPSPQPGHQISGNLSRRRYRL